MRRANRGGETTEMWRARRGAALALSLALAGCGAAEVDGAGDNAAETGRVLNVEVSAVELTDFVEVIRLPGTVAANRDVVVSAEESGIITEVLVEKGSAVSQGQPIARIDNRLLAPQVAQARSQAALASEVWARRKRLYEEDHVGSELAYLEARFQSESADATLATLERRLEQTVVTAPVEGILDDRMVEVGTMVSPGTPVARIVDLDPIKVIGGVPERYAADVHSGARASVTFDALEERAFDGVVNFVGSTVDPSNRTFPIEFRLPNPDRAMKPEMVANVEVVRRVIEDAVVVPQDVLVRVEGGYTVYLVVGETVEARPVTAGPSQRNLVVITEGLTAGDRIIVVGQKQVAAGDRVRIVGEG